MADGHNRGRSSQREFAFRSQGLALVEVCLALFERDHGLPPEVLEPSRRQLGVSHRVLDVAVAEVSLQRPGVQDGVGEIDLIPTQVYKLGRPQTVAEGDKDHGGIPVTPAIGLGGTDQPIDLAAGQVLAGPVFGSSVSVSVL